MDNTPLVSILMTAYNRECFIVEAIESVLASTYSNFELIIVDDCSIDNTVKLVRPFLLKDSRVKLFINEKNLGDYPNRNKAALYASGKYLKYVDSDDMLYPEGLQYCINQMETNKEADWGSMYTYDIKKEFLLTPKEAINRHFFDEPFLKIGPGGTILKQDFFLKIGMYPTLYGPANDMYFNLKAAASGNTLLLNHCFLFYRIHQGQEINNHFSYLHNNYRFLDDALTQLQLPLDKKEKRWIKLKLKRRFSVNIVKYLFNHKDIKKTLEAIKYANFTLVDFLAGIFHIIRKP